MTNSPAAPASLALASRAALALAASLLLAGPARAQAPQTRLRATIEAFRAEEVEHRDIGLEHEAELTPGYRVLAGIIKAGCKVAIAVSERV